MDEGGDREGSMESAVCAELSNVNVVTWKTGIGPRSGILSKRKLRYLIPYLNIRGINIWIFWICDQTKPYNSPSVPENLFSFPRP